MIKTYSDDIDLYITSFPNNLDTFEVMDTKTKDPHNCIFRKEYYHDVMNKDGLERINPNDVEPYQQKAIVLFVFGELSWE